MNIYHKRSVAFGGGMLSQTPHAHFEFHSPLVDRVRYQPRYWVNGTALTSPLNAVFIEDLELSQVLGCCRLSGEMYGPHSLEDMT